MKLCKDCVHCIPATDEDNERDKYRFARCAVSATPEEVDIVSGLTRETRLKYCDSARYLGPCSVEGELFEARK